MLGIRFYIILTAICLACSGSALAQGAGSCFRDDFSQKDGSLFVTESNPYCRILNGSLYQESQDPNYSLSTVSLPANSDYCVITASIRQVGGPDNRGFGLVFMGKSIANTSVFFISSTGYFCIADMQGGKHFPLAGWTKCDAIKPSGSDNVLRVQKSRYVTDFYINDVKVFSTNRIKWRGNIHGYAARQGVDFISKFFELRTIGNPFGFDSSRRELLASLNSHYAEIAPRESDDGKVLYFSRVSHPSNLGDDDDCDIWASDIADGVYSEPRHLSRQFNNKNINAVIMTSNNGKALYVEGSYADDSITQGVTLFTKISDSYWSKPKPVEIAEFYNNSKRSTFAFSSDMRVLVQALSRDDTYGGLDLYISFRKPDGSYSAPKNLGQVLNTSLDDGTPYISPDDKMLFFSSYGHEGFGNSDIFVSRRLDDSWAKWSAPENLGNAVNSPDWDAYFSYSADGQSAYFVSTNNDDFSECIYKIKLPEKLCVDNGKSVSGKVHGASGEPLVATVSFSCNGNADEAVSQQDGRFRLDSDPKLGGRLKLSAPGYWTCIMDVGPDTKMPLDIALQPLCKGATIVLKNINFKTASNVIVEGSVDELDFLVDVMRKNPSMKILLLGYAYPKGNPQELVKLSESRALTIKTYLTKHGVAGSRIQYKGLGGANPINKGKTEEDRIKNRRVEFNILEY